MDNLCLTLLDVEKIDENRLEAWIEFAILRHLSRASTMESTFDAGACTANKTESEDDVLTCRKMAIRDGMSLLQNLTRFAVRKGESDHYGHTLLSLLLKSRTLPLGKRK